MPVQLWTVDCQESTWSWSLLNNPLKSWYLHLARKYHNSLSMLYDRKGLPSDSQYGLLCHLNQKPKRQNERKWHAVHWLYNLGIMLFSVYFPKKFSVSGLWAGDSSPHQSLSRLQDLIYKHSLVNIQVRYNQRCNFTIQKYQFSLFYTTTVNTNWRVILL
jgi:hypothetical protein